MYPETITLEVTQEHIDNGEPLWFHKRPIALAMRDRGFRNPQAGKTWIWLPNSKKNNGKPYPGDVNYYPVGTHREEMDAWTRAFDEGEGVEPITLVFTREGAFRRVLSQGDYIMNDEKMTIDELKADFDAFKAEHGHKANAKQFNFYIIGTKEMLSWKRPFEQDLRAWGFEYCQKYDCWYWHEHLERQRASESVLELKDERMIERVLYPAKFNHVDLG